MQSSNENICQKQLFIEFENNCFAFALRDCTLSCLKFHIHKPNLEKKQLIKILDIFFLFLVQT